MTPTSSALTTTPPTKEQRGPVPHVKSSQPADPRSQRIREERGHIQKIACSVGVAAVEILSGQRPLAQLSRWLDSRLFDTLTHRTILTQRLTNQAQVTPLHFRARPVRCRVQRVAPGVYETVVLIQENIRVRALAIRIEQKRGMWKVSALDIA